MFPGVRLAGASRVPVLSWKEWCAVGAWRRCLSAVPAGSGLSEFLSQTGGDLSTGERRSTERTEGNVKPTSPRNESTLNFEKRSYRPIHDRLTGSDPDAGTRGTPFPLPITSAT